MLKNDFLVGCMEMKCNLNSDTFRAWIKDILVWHRFENKIHFHVVL